MSRTQDMTRVPLIRLADKDTGDDGLEEKKYFNGTILSVC